MLEDEEKEEEIEDAELVIDESDSLSLSDTETDTEEGLWLPAGQLTATMKLTWALIWCHSLISAHGRLFGALKTGAKK